MFLLICIWMYLHEPCCSQQKDEGSYCEPTPLRPYRLDKISKQHNYMHQHQLSALVFFCFLNTTNGCTPSGQKHGESFLLLAFET